MEELKTTGLMKKTKKELIEIIFRKDDVERKLKEDNEKTSQNLRIAKNEIDILCKSQNESDEKVARLKKTIVRQNNQLIVSVFIFLTIIVLILCVF